MPRLAILGVLAVTGALSALVAGCERLGYTDRILHRVSSPDGRLVAVCQEVPVFDGPTFDVRLEHPDGRLVRELFQMGDGGGCNELRWSDDGRLLAVLTSHVAGIMVADVEWAVAHPQERNSHWFVRWFSFSTESTPKRAMGLTFIAPLELEFQLCQYSLDDTARNGRQRECSQPAQSQRLRVPHPLVADRPV